MSLSLDTKNNLNSLPPPTLINFHTILEKKMADSPEFFNFANQYEEDTSVYSSHREWQESTILGKLTLLMIRLGDNSFFHAIADSLSDQEGGDSPIARFLTLFANLGAVIAAICGAYAFGRILQIFIGKEIVINQEVIIEEEVTLSDLKKQIASEKKKERRSAKDKKEKSS